MKCSKCGEICRTNQAFCIKCGSPIHVVPDFNIIEAELANSVGALLNEDKKSNDSENDVGFVSSNNEENDEEEIVHKQDNDKNSDAEENAEDDRGSRNPKKKKFIIGSLIGVVILILIAVTVTANVLSNKENSFTAQYDKGIEYYNDGDYEKALEKLTSAQKVTDTDDQKIKVKEALWNTYNKIGDKDQEVIELLKELIKLNPKEGSYYEALVTLYIDNGMEKEAQELINSIEDNKIYDLVSGYGVAVPSPSVKSGNYDKYITVELSSLNADCIYYTLDGSEPRQTSTLYEAPVEIKSEGTISLKAIAVSKSGLESKILQAEYVIKLSELPSPVVTPASGDYTENTKITVNVPEGATVYYTFDGTVPTSSSSVYSEPIAMLRGNNVFKAIAINNKGITSTVVTNIYNLKIPQNYSTSEAINLLKESFVKDGKIKDNKGSSNDGKYNFTYKETTFIDNDEYYIIKIDFIDSKDNVKATNYYGVNTESGTIIAVSSNSSGQYFATN